MYTGLLSCTNADSLSVLNKAYGIGLCIFQDDQRNLHISLGFFRKLFILCYNIGDQRIINCQLLAALFKGDSKYLFVLQRFRNIVFIDLDHIVIAFFLLLQNFKSLLCISRCDHTIRNLSLDQHCGIFVADIRKRNKITK